MTAGRGSSVIQAGAPGAGGTINQPRVTDSPDENPSLVLWHGKDPRLQSQQIVQEAQDRAFNYLSEYRIVDNKFVRLSDDALRTVNIVGHDHFAYGTDSREYDVNASYSGRRYEDVYSVDLKTGERKHCSRSTSRRRRLPSPDGRSLLYWGDDAQWWIADVATGEKRVDHEGRAGGVRRHLGRPQQSRHAAERRHSAGRRTEAPCSCQTASTSGRCRSRRRGRRISPWTARRTDSVSAAVRVRAAGASRGGAARWRRWSRRTRRRRSGRHRPVAADVLRDVRRVDEEGRARRRSIRRSRARSVSPGRTRSSRSRRRRTPTSTSTREQTSANYPNYYVASADLMTAPRTGRSSGASAHRRESAAEGLRVDERREADQLHQRQGRQAAGRAVPAGELRAGQEVPDARHDLREALESGEQLRHAK